MPCRVLLVEDETLIAMMVEDLLDQSGCEPVLAATGAEALALIAKGPAFELAVIDLQLPDGNGFGVIRALWDRSPVPVIISTGYGNLSGDEREALLPFAAPLEVMLKPWGEDQLRDLVLRFLPQAQKRAT